VENPDQYKDQGGSSSGGNNNNTGASEVEKTPVPVRLMSMEQFMAERAEQKGDAWEPTAYKAYMFLLAKVFKASTTQPPEIKALLLEAEKYIKQFFIGEPLNNCLNAAYQGLLGPRPGDDLRKITPAFLVDGHQWKHYQNGDKKWGLFVGHSWEEVHKIIVYGAKLILAARAIEIDGGAKVQDQILDGFVQFDQNVGTPGDFVKKEVSVIKIQISRSSVLVSGHGYPVPTWDSGFPFVKGTLAAAYQEALLGDNNSMRSKT
jgi:hypothetical protein